MKWKPVYSMRLGAAQGNMPSLFYPIMFQCGDLVAIMRRARCKTPIKAFPQADTAIILYDLHHASFIWPRATRPNFISPHLLPSVTRNMSALRESEFVGSLYCGTA
jgi:hypothetical protein